MKILTCTKCQSQFDVASMQPGSNFVCGKCRNVLVVPSAAPVVQPTPVMRPMSPASAAPATVALSPDEMRRALAQARGAAPDPAAAGRGAPKLPPAMEARRQQQATAAPTRAGGQAAAPAPAAPPAARAPAAPARAAAPAPAAARPAPAAAARPAPAARAETTAAEGGGRRPRRGRADSGGDVGGDGAPEKKSQVGLYAGIGAGALLLIVGGLIVANRNKGDAATDTATDTASAKTPAGTNAAAATAGVTPPVGANGAPAAKTAEPEPANLDDWARFLRMDASAQLAFIATQRQAAIAANDLVKLKSLYDWFEDPRVKKLKIADDTRKACIDDALRVDENLEWANVAKGRRNLHEFLKTVRQENAKAFAYRDRDERELDRMLESSQAKPWVDEKAFSKVSELANRVRARNKQFEDSPQMARAFEKAAWLSDNPLFKEFKFEIRFEDPYVICQQYEEFKDESELHKNKDRIAKAKTIANRDVIIFSELNRHFRSLVADRFKLPDLKEKKRILFAVITWNNEAFIELHRKANNGEAPSPWIRAFYSPPEQKIFHYIGDDSLRAQDEWPVAGGRIQKTSDQVTFHEGTHQLQHEYGALYRGKPLVDGDTKVSPRRAMWFDEGFAEFMGSVEVDAASKETLVGAKFAHNRLLGERIMQVVGDGRVNNHRDIAKKWTIEEMIKPNHNGELLELSGKLYPQNGVYMANLFYSRAWGFVHFCWFYDNGKYRSKFLDYMETVFKEQHGADSLAKAFGRKNAKDWKGIEDEFEWYWDRCLARRFGWKDSGRTKPYNTETDPPSGKYDPNEGKDEDE